jgi:hypothetical protein
VSPERSAANRTDRGEGAAGCVASAGRVQGTPVRDACDASACSRVQVLLQGHSTYYATMRCRCLICPRTPASTTNWIASRLSNSRRGAERRTVGLTSARLMTPAPARRLQPGDAPSQGRAASFIRPGADLLPGVRDGTPTPGIGPGRPQEAIHDASQGSLRIARRSWLSTAVQHLSRACRGQRPNRRERIGIQIGVTRALHGT